HGLGLPEEEAVTSPTFALVHEYECGPQVLVHADLYRLAHPDELFDLGLEDVLGTTAIALIEWGERFVDALAGVALLVRLEGTAGGGRRIAFEAHGDRGRALVSSLIERLAPA